MRKLSFVDFCKRLNAHCYGRAAARLRRFSDRRILIYQTNVHATGTQSSGVAEQQGNDAELCADDKGLATAEQLLQTSYRLRRMIN